jgi:FHS family glucose/mannose:H+ symporter-like MFS transporter
MSRKSLLITLSAFASITVVGVFHTIMGTALEEMRSFFGIGLVQAGIFGTAYWLGFTVAVFTAGVLSDYHPRILVLAGACILTALCGLTLGLGSLFWLNLIVVFFLGAGNGATVSSSSALLIELHTGKEGKTMSLHHFFYAIGAIGGPMIMGYFLSIGWEWQLIYRVAGAVCLSVAVLLLLFSAAGAGAREPRVPGHKGRIIGQMTMLVLAGLTILGIGTQNGVIYWVVPFLLNARAVPIFQASLGLALISVGMGAGRLALIWLSSRVSYTRILIGLFACVNVSLILLLLLSNEVLNLVFCFLAGCGFSGLFPILLALGGTMFPSRSGTAVGIISTSAGLGSAMMPWVVSQIAEGRSLGLGMGISVLTAFLGLCLVLVASRTGEFEQVKAKSA